MGDIERALRERLEMAGCYPTGRDQDGRELWFTPHLNRAFPMPQSVTAAAAANAVLRAAGMEDAF
ncbi:MAG: hypothetical protein R3229_11720 [Alphaproteobacteria bacterium]|nr:hypothetical protein [Alphaproteobacteria bacterium]